MEFIQEITLDLNANTTYTTVAAKQRDSARWLKIHLTKNNLSYNLDPSHSFMFRMRKPDGHGVINPAFVELNSTDLYIPIDITKENYNNYVNYYKEVEDNVYETVPVSTFFSQIEEYEEGCYVQDANGRYIEATSEDSPPYYEFIGAPTGVQIYYLQNNINLAESTVNVQLTEQVLAVSGRGYADIIEYDGIGNVLSSVSFIVNVMASPDVAGNATSTDEFQKLTDVVAQADDIIGEAEAWTRGTIHDIIINDPSYIIDKNINADNFANKNKAYLYTKNDNNEYVKVDASASFQSNLTYYYLDASQSNNAKYYADQAATQWGYYNNLSVTADPSYTGETADVELVSDSQDPSLTVGYIFKLPAGPQGIQGDTGATGPATCVASDVEPTDPAVEVWIDTTGETKPFIGTANQVYYDQQATYDTHTVGEFLQGIGDLTEQAEAAKTAAIAAQQAATNASNSASTAISDVASVSAGLTTERQERTNADITLNNAIQGKITMPTDVDLNNGIYTLAYTISSEGSERVKDLHWGHDSYNNLSNRPYINGTILTGDSNLNLITNTNKAVQSSHLDDNIVASLDKADSAIQIVQLNNELLIPADYKGPYIIDTDVTASNWDQVKTSLYYYDTTSNNYGHITEDSSYSSNMVYYTHDSTYDDQKFVDLGTVLKEDNIVKDNLLDNPWFQVNQHNFSEKTVNRDSVGSYLCDRWKVMLCQDQTRIITLSNTGVLHISAGEGADPLKDFVIGQVFDEDFSQSLIGKTVCLSVGYIENDQIKYGSGFGLCTAQGTPFIQLDENLDWYVRLAKVEQTNRLAFQITSAQNITGKQITPKEIYIKNTKLEIGKFSTLPQDIAPVLASELTKCQKYFCKIVGQPYSETEVPTVIGFGILGATKQLDWSLSLPLSMTVPSALTYIYASTDLIIRRGITATSSAGTLPSSAIASSTKFNGINGVYFQTAASGTLATYSPYYVLLPNAAASNTGLPFVAISAEL